MLPVPKELVGIDLNPTNILFLKTSRHPEITRSRKALRDHGVRVSFFLHDLRKKKREFYNHFDAIYASGVLGMFSEEDTRRILRLLARYLKPHGKLVMVSWTDDRLSQEKLAERKRYGWYWRKNPEVKKMGVLMKKSGFDIIKFGVHNVADPEKYEWGIIYGYVARKR